MSMVEKIRTARNEARRSKMRTIEVRIFNLLLGEIDTVEKRSGNTMTDSQIVDLVKKVMKSNSETLTLIERLPNAQDDINRLKLENAYLVKFLPAQLSEDEIRRIIAEQNLQGVPAVMQYLNSNYSGQFDKALASSIARSI